MSSGESLFSDALTAQASNAQMIDLRTPHVSAKRHATPPLIEASDVTTRPCIKVRLAVEVGSWDCYRQ